MAKEIIDHFEKRLEAMDGKAMVVCLSRRICIDLYHELASRRPNWEGDDNTAALKVVMTGAASDPPEWQPHIRNKAGREALAKRFRDPSDPLRIVIVRDMWLTGFDAPSLHTMYVDKPMRGHGLMQAITRVNRVFRDKPGGLVVDYLGLAHELKQALATYTESGGTGQTALDQEQAVRAALSKRASIGGKTEEELDHVVRQIVSRVVASDGVLDIFAAAGLKKPDVSILSEEFLAEVRGMRRRNLACRSC